jgi:2-oxoglutarate dehydrogenase E2 component (dihydrolipoamide succinyltransferase)
MSVEVRVPSIGESITSATIAKWLKAPGEYVAQDEPLVALDSDKATVELPSPAAGVLADQAVAAGEEVAIGALLGHIEPGPRPAAAPPAPDAAPAGPPATEPAPPPAAATVPQVSPSRQAPAPAAEPPERPGPTSPSVRRAAREVGVDAATLHGSGPNGRVTRADVTAASHPAEAPAAKPTKAPPVSGGEDEPVEVVPMTSLRKRIAERLVQAQQTAAILTTFNEIDMTAVLALRERYQERFTKRYGIKLGFMSFFVKASIEALKAFPSANAELRGSDILYKHYYHVGVAVSGPRGLVVPVVRHADRLSFAETEKAITDFGQRARDNALTIDDLQGGTFTVSNGGIFGSLMSTPILNPPQVAILGMHAIQKRAVVIDDQIVIRPMMYVAVSYDHRLLDGREAVSFLVRIKECVEDPERVLLEV